MKNVDELIAKEEARTGLPTGLLRSIVQQETGGNKKYLEQPDTYHYAANSKGKRVAGHTGKVSTAFGPFGLLESTAKKPGYGVAPLKDKSLEEQVRFASDYLGARIKSAGDLVKGVGGYGEGDTYANKVLSRLGWAPDKAVAAVAPVPVQEVAKAVPSAVNASTVAQVPIVSFGDEVSQQLASLYAALGSKGSSTLPNDRAPVTEADLASFGKAFGLTM